LPISVLYDIRYTLYKSASIAFLILMQFVVRQMLFYLIYRSKF